MIELFQVYKVAFILSPIAAILLCIVGTHLVSRNQGLQLMALSQAALLGNILGELFHENVAGLIISLLLLLIVKGSFHFFNIVRSQAYIVFYLSFIALSYILVTLFPDLDAHFNTRFFGDIVSIPNERATLLTVVFSILIIIYYFINKKMIRTSINQSLLKINKFSFLEEAYFIVSILLSLYGLGFLFTMCFLMFPVLITGNKFASFTRSLFILSALSALASVFGLTASIMHSRVSTVPAQVLILILLMLITRFFNSSQKRTS